MVNIPAISGFADVSAARVVLFQSGRQVHAPANAIGLSFAVGTRTELKAIPTGTATIAYLTEDGREGVFEWTLGNYATRIAADTQEGIYLAADDTASTDGAWVRVVQGTVGGLDTLGGGHWFADWFGIPHLGVGQAHTQMSAMINLGNIVKPSSITLGSKGYQLGAALPDFNWQVELIGQRGFQGTIIQKAYVEADAVRGILAFNDYGFTVDGISFASTAPASGGSGISAILTGMAPAAGRTFIRNCHISLGDLCNHSLYIDGSTNTTPAGPSYRGVWIENCELFGAAISAVKLLSVQHLFVTGSLIVHSGGTGTTALDITGDVDAYCDDIHTHGLIAGDVSLDWLSRSTFISPLTDNLTATANCSGISWVGEYLDGTHDLEWLNSSISSTGTRFSIADDGVALFPVSAANYTSVLVSLTCGSAISAISPNGLIFVRAAEPAVQNIALASATNIDFTTGVLGGTTGTDGRFTISVAGSGDAAMLYLENRTGSARSVSAKIVDRF